MDLTFWHSQIPLVSLALRAVLIYLLLLAGLRVFGKREVGQFTLFDLVFVLLVSNAVQPAMTGPDTSWVGGVVIIASLLAVNYSLSWLRVRSTVVRRLLQPPTTVLAEQGHWLPERLRRAGVDQEDVMAALREHGLNSIADTRAVNLEADGSISVVPVEGHPVSARRRTVRFLHHH
ncbi:MAG: DUF421 domain-containing protein [Candidatus Dormibacteria bacterium]